MSAPLALLQILWDSHRSGSWAAINRSMRSGLSLCISSGMKFELTDIETLGKRFRWHYWSSGGESFYSLACGLGHHNEPPNISAARSLEHHFGRPAYILNGHRLALGSRLQWEGEDVTVTSFTRGTHSAFIACSYHYSDRGEDVTWKIKHRYTITRKELKAMEKAAKATS